MDKQKTKRPREMWGNAMGGDHWISYPIMKAPGNQMPLGCIHIGAHCDSSGEYDATTNTAHVGGQMLFEILALMMLNQNWQSEE